MWKYSFALRSKGRSTLCTKPEKGSPKSNNQLMPVDIQRCGYRMFDPEIASLKLIDEEEVLFSAGNLSKEAINNLIMEDERNGYCSLLTLKGLKML